MKKTRQKLGLTQEQIAKELNCSLRAIWKIENSEMSRSIAQRYHDYLSHKLFERNALILSEELHKKGIDAFVSFEKSKLNGIYTYVFKSTHAHTVSHNPYNNLFYHWMSNEFSQLEIFNMQKNCDILNNKLKSL
jgi:transcriptional regulator with XRE-family HTH domain